MACLQRISIEPNDLPLNARYPKGYTATWGGDVLTLSRHQPQRVQQGMGARRFDAEGRALITEFEDFTLLNVVAPAGTNGRGDWFYKMAFLYHLHDVVAARLALGENIILCCSLYIAHRDVDLSRPLQVAGYQPEERDYISELLDLGLVDIFRTLYPETRGYTWHSAREVGWRVDYVFGSLQLTPRRADILTDVEGSAHLPMIVDIDIEEK